MKRTISMRRLLVTATLCLGIQAHAADEPYYSMREALIAAVKSPEKTIHYDDTLGAASPVRAMINKPDAKVVAEITTLAKLEQPGCSRLQVHVTTPGTLLPTSAGDERPLDAKMELNICEDGRPLQQSE